LRLDSFSQSLLKKKRPAVIRALLTEIGLRSLAEQGEMPDWKSWLLHMFPGYFMSRGGSFIPFAGFHNEFWEWVDGMTVAERPEALIAIWSRDTGKSTNAELAAIRIGALGKRRYALYICGTQAQADDHVSNIASMLESPQLAAAHPAMSDRLLSKYGYSRGWTAARLRTASGYTIDALGLDSRVRGARLEEFRPDLIILDDVDDKKDSVKAVEKKIATVTRDILPAGASNLATVFCQNLIHAGSIAAKLSDGSADFLARRRISGPHPAVEGLTFKTEGTRTVVTGGRPTWAGLDLDRCQELIDDIGLTAFLVEHQHEKHLAQGLYLADIWLDSTHVLKPFPIPLAWHIDRTMDWGSDKPYAVLWFAESDGTTPADTERWGLRTFPKGTVFVIAELYGWNGTPNRGARHSPEEIARRVIRAQENATWGKRVRSGPADLPPDLEGDSMADRMGRMGVKWDAVKKGSGSRISSGDKVKTMLEEARKAPMEDVGLFLFNTCTHGIRTLPVLPKDPMEPDDVDTDAEDHWWDALRARVWTKRRTATRRQIQFG